MDKFTLDDLLRFVELEDKRLEKLGYHIIMGMTENGVIYGKLQKNEKLDEKLDEFPLENLAGDELVSVVFVTMLLGKSLDDMT